MHKSSPGFAHATEPTSTCCLPFGKRRGFCGSSLSFCLQVPCCGHRERLGPAQGFGRKESWSRFF